MPPILPCRAVRELDRIAIEELGMPGLVLMENAGRNIAELILQGGPCRHVLIACGRGNNGGDGLVVARHLDLQNVQVDVLLTAPPESLSPDAAANLNWLAASRVRIHRWPAKDTPTLAALFDELPHAFDWVVDALLGTGTRGEPRPPLAELIEQLNAVSARKLAVDVPSGLDADTGQSSATTFRADVTATLAAKKPGLVAESAREYVGQLEVLSIGVPIGLYARVQQPPTTHSP